MYRLYDYLPSGNGYKVRLVLKELALPYELPTCPMAARTLRSISPGTTVPRSTCPSAIRRAR